MQGGIEPAVIAVKGLCPKPLDDCTMLGAGGRIRTYVGRGRQVYSLPPLAGLGYTREIGADTQIRTENAQLGRLALCR